MLILGIILYLAIGLYIVRTPDTASWIAMIHYNFPYLGWALLFGVIFLWPLFLLWLGVGHSVAYFQKRS